MVSPLGPWLSESLVVQTKATTFPLESYTGPPDSPEMADAVTWTNGGPLLVYRPEILRMAVLTALKGPARG